MLLSVNILGTFLHSNVNSIHLLPRRINIIPLVRVYFHIVPDHCLSISKLVN